MAAQPEVQVEFGDEVAEHRLGARRPTDREAVDPGPADQHRMCSQREGDQDVRAAPNSAVKQHRYPPLDCGDDARQRIQRADRPVELASAVVADDDTVGSVFDGELRVIRVLDSLQQDGKFGALANEIEILPGQG